MAPGVLLMDTISLKHSITAVTINPATIYDSSDPNEPARTMIEPVRIKRPIPMVAETAIPEVQVSRDMDYPKSSIIAYQ